MIETKRKEELSKSYLNAICAYKGIAVESQLHDDDSLDVMLKKVLLRRDDTRFNAQIHVQLKATSQKLIENETNFSFELSVKNYDDLRMKCATPMILCVLRLPIDENTWLSHTVDELILRECMFWINLANEPETQNASTVTIHVPLKNTVTPDTMLSLLEKVAEDGSL